MNELCRTIMRNWNGDKCAEAKDRTPGGMWFAKAPGKAADGGNEYIVYTVQSGALELTFTSRLERTGIQFNLYTPKKDGAEQLSDIRDWMVVGFDDVQLEMFPDVLDRPRTMVSCTRTNFGEVIPDPEAGYQCTLLYDVVYWYETSPA